MSSAHPHFKHPMTTEIRKDPRVVDALRAAMKAGRKNELVLIANIEDFAPPEVRAAFEALVDTVAAMATERAAVIAADELGQLRDLVKRAFPLVSLAPEEHHGLGTGRTPWLHDARVTFHPAGPRG